jgi:hypothetical protein
MNGAPILKLAYEYISIARRNIGRLRKNGGTETHVQREQAWNGFYLTADVTWLRRKNVTAGRYIFIISS